MIKKIIGYVSLILGAALLVINIGALKTKLNIPIITPILTSVPSLYITIAGVVLAGIGLVLLFKGGTSKQSPEVPIYHGNKVVGYRRR